MYNVNIKTREVLTMKKKFLYVVCVFLLAFTLAFSACNDNSNSSSSTGVNSDGDSSGSSSDSSVNVVVPEIPDDVPSNSTFTITSEDGGVYSYDEESGRYTISAAGTYDCTGNIAEGQIYVNAGDESAVTINLNSVKIACSTDSAIYVESADEVDISAKKGTQNYVYDVRTTAIADDDETSGTAAIYAKADLTIKGKGELIVKSAINNGIHTKKDLDIKNLTLTVKAINNAIKGNDSVTFDSATVVAISTAGDGIKTKSTDLNKKGVQRGTININSGSVSVFASCDGIDASADVNVLDGATLYIATDSYSEYSVDPLSKSENVIYIRFSSSLYEKNYVYSACFYNTNGDEKIVKASFEGSSQANTDGPGGFRPGFGGFGGFSGGSTYYYYKFSCPSGYESVKIYAYSSTTDQTNNENYVGVTSSDTTLSDYYDTIAISSISNKVIYTSGWTSYATKSGNSGVDYSCKGIKAGNQIVIDGGTIEIKSTDDSMHANFDDILESTSAKGLGNITINGGTITLITKDDGIHADQDVLITGGSITVTTAYEGVEGNRIYVNGGYLKVYATDDAMNANSNGAYTAYIEFNGGVTDCEVGTGDTDTIDSNGSLKITGGIVVAKCRINNASSMTAGTFDVENTITVTGGTVISLGCRQNEIPGSTKSSDTVSTGEYTLKDSSGNVLATFTVESSLKGYMVYSSTSCTLYKGENTFIIIK